MCIRDRLNHNYQIDENPGMGKQGLFYYYHTMAKALSLAGIDSLKGLSGEKKDWRQDLALTLFDLQSNEGFWVNDSGRWWEKDPVLVTCYAMLALERVYYAL